MRLISMSLGSWFPKTIIHLKEFENFLRGKQLDKHLDIATATKLYLGLDPSFVTSHTNEEGIKYVRGMSEHFDFTYFGDGLLVVRKQVTDFDTDRESMLWFYRKCLTPIFSFLYSRGAKGLEIIRRPGLHKPLFVHIQATEDREVRDFFINAGEEIHSMYEYKECNIYYADNLIAIVTPLEKPALDLDRLIEYLILFNEVKRHSGGLLETHRYIWDEAEKIISDSRIIIKDLPRYNETLTDFSNTVDNITARIDQMRLNFTYRVQKIQKSHSLFPKLAPIFENLEQNLDYIKNLFLMTDQHLSNNIEHISAIYQENQDNALNKLQFLFLLSVVASFVSLGSYMVYQRGNPDADYASFLNFDIVNMMKFGGAAFVITYLIYYIWNYRYQNLHTRLKKM